MNFTKTLFAVAIGSIGIMNAMSASAVTLATGDKLSITTGSAEFDSGGNLVNVTSGSWFAMDTNKNGVIKGSEKVVLAEGSTGLIIGVATTAGASHDGSPVIPPDTNAITAPWEFFGNTGSDFTTIGITQTSATTLDFGGWTVTWNGIPSINMAAGAWGTGFTNGVANLVWDGNYGSAYTLDYHATVPVGDPSNFGGVQYALHLEGFATAAPVPEASTYGMMLAGLGLVGFMASRRRKSI